MEWSQIVYVISNWGFPIFVAIWLLTKVTKTLDKISVILERLDVMVNNIKEETDKFSSVSKDLTEAVTMIKMIIGREKM